MKIAFQVLFLVSLLTANEYKDTANKFLEFKGISKTIVTQEIMKINDQEIAYLFNLSDSGYLLVPINKTSSPIKAYSFSDEFKNLPTAYKDFLLSQLYTSKENRTLSRTIDTTISDRWNFLKTYTKPLARVLYSYIPDTKLLQTSWNQEYPYNKYLPKVAEESTLAGCVQVAMGQVMNFHAHPKKAKGVITNQMQIKDATGAIVRTDSLKAVLNRDYNWNIMPLDHTNPNEYQNDELAYLIRDLAIVNNATMGLAETSASTNKSAIVEKFGYSNTIAEMKLTTENKDLFISTLKNQIDLEQPALFSVPGHMVVADGYKDDASGNYIHFNMGWGGSEDNYYNLDDHIVAGSYNFGNTNLSYIYNIKPCIIGEDCYINLEDTDSVSDLNITGTFNNPDDSDNYQFYLSGTTIFNGNRGYNNPENLYFWIHIYDGNNTLVQATDTPLSINLEPGLYDIKISLQNVETGTYWQVDNHENYTLTITSEALSDSQKEIILQSLNSPPIIDQTITDKIITNDTKILIHAYDENSEDNLTLSAVANENINLSFENNILTLSPTVPKGYSKVVVKVESNGVSAEKEFNVLINDSTTYFGKEFVLNSKLDSQSEFEKTEVLLEGICTIKGDNGYSNQAFYTSLMQLNENYLVTMNDEAITSVNLVFDKYLLGASFEQNPGGSGTYYPYEESHANYSLSVSCPDADENITKLANILGISIEENTTELLHLQASWNLVSASIPFENLNADMKILWQYENFIWKVHAENFDTSNYDAITDISSDKGTWILSTSDQNISIAMDETPITYNYTNGWTLNGTNSDLNASTVSCQSAQLQSIWKYIDGLWKVYTPLNATNDYGSFEIINKNEGFWVHCKL